ncbi:MAG TPA: hypothetical protein VGW77_01050 [Candidatus Binatia bacterium]|nr:hypothetical protein [Candidatus Binatia bacterium]
MIAGVYSLLSLPLFLFLPQCVIAQAYPKQAINLIIPLAPGDSTDVAGRTIGERIIQALESAGRGRQRARRRRNDRHRQRGESAQGVPVH